VALGPDDPTWKALCDALAALATESRIATSPSRSRTSMPSSSGSTPRSTFQERVSPWSERSHASKRSCSISRHPVRTAPVKDARASAR